VIKVELNAEQAVAVRYALLLHTKDDSVSFPSERVKLIREAITALHKEIEETTTE